MPSETGASTSYWMNRSMPAFEPLTADTRADVCVIGAGMAGLSVAYQLAREGRSVIVLEQGTIGSGETGRTTSHLSNAFDDRYHHVERWHGEEVSRLVAQSHTAAIDRIEDIVREERIDCDFRRVDGYLFEPPDAPERQLDEELQAAHRAGLTDVRRVDAPPGSSVPLGPALHFPRQGQLHPLAYLGGLANAVIAHGGRIHGSTPVVGVHDGHPTRVETRDGRVVTAAASVVATNTPFNNRFVIHTKQAAYRTYVVGLRVAKGSVPWVQYWDTLDPYHYVRIAGELDAQHDLLIVGGADHKTGQGAQEPSPFEHLHAWSRERFPVLGEPVVRWSGQVMEPVDGLAFIGRNPGDNHVYIVTGDSGNGMTHGAIAGMLLADLIQGRDNPWRTAYDPARKSLRAGSEYTRENANVAAQYADWVTPGEVQAPQEIAPGEGAVIRAGLKKIAVYRDPQGQPHAFDATCPHLGCIVEWNGIEKSWDCPCHGSRFDCTGQVVHGPATRGLSPTKV